MQLQPNQASCLPTAFAMVLEIPVEQVFQELGHDGMAIWWPGENGSMKYRGFHIQEMIDLCHAHGYVVTPIEPQPVASPRPDLEPRPYELQTKSLVRIHAYLDNTKGVLVGEGKSQQSKMGHAAAWFDGMVHDPNGTTYGIEHFGIREFWRMTRRP